MPRRASRTQYVTSLPSLATLAPRFQRRLAAAAALSFAVLGTVSAALIVSSELEM